MTRRPAISEIVSVIAIIGVLAAAMGAAYLVFHERNVDIKDITEGRLAINSMKANELLVVTDVHKINDTADYEFILHNYSDDHDVILDDFEYYSLPENQTEGDLITLELWWANDTATDDCGTAKITEANHIAFCDFGGKYLTNQGDVSILKAGENSRVFIKSDNVPRGELILITPARDFIRVDIP